MHNISLTLKHLREKKRNKPTLFIVLLNNSMLKPQEKQFTTPKWIFSIIYAVFMSRRTSQAKHRSTKENRNCSWMILWRLPYHNWTMNTANNLKHRSSVVIIDHGSRASHTSNNYYWKPSIPTVPGGKLLRGIAKKNYHIAQCDETTKAHQTTSKKHRHHASHRSIMSISGISWDISNSRNKIRLTGIRTAWRRLASRA